MTNLPIPPNPTAESTAISALTLAFSTDPAVRWMYPEADRYLTHFPAFVRAFAGKAFVHGTAHSRGATAAAALWLPPGIEPDEEEVIGVLQDSVPEGKQDDLFAMFEQMGQAHPTGPHWYLPLIGVDPACQNRGHGSALLRAGLDRCDREQLPAYLEATSPQNVPLYERHGFRVVATLQAGASPKLTAMLRRPQ